MVIENSIKTYNAKSTLLFTCRHGKTECMNSKKIISVCKDNAKCFEEIAEQLATYGSQQKAVVQTVKTIINYVDELDEKVGDVPPEWFDYTVSQFYNSWVMTNPKEIGKLIKKYGDEFSTQTLEKVNYWKKNPFTWMFFSFVEDHGEDIFTVCDELSREQHLLYSPSLTSLRTNEKLRKGNYLALIVPNEECLQASGLIHHIHLQSRDMDSFCKILDPIGYASGGITQVINNRYIEFCKLSIRTVISEDQHRLFNGIFCWAELHLPGIRSIEIPNIPGSWEVDETLVTSKQLVRLSYLKIEPTLSKKIHVPEAMLDGRTTKKFWDIGNEVRPDLYINLATDQVAISSLSQVGFNIVLCLLAHIFPQSNLLGGKPDYVMSLFTSAFLKEVDDIVLPWRKFMEPFNEFNEIDEVDELDEFDKFDEFDEMEEEPEISDKIDRIYKVLAPFFSKIINSADPEELKKITEDLGLDPEELSAFMEQVESQIEKESPHLELSQEDEVLAIEFPISLNFLRPLFNDHLVNSELFDINDDEESYALFATLTNNNFANEVQATGLCDYVTDLFLEEFGAENGLQIMGQLFYMLLLSSDEKLLVRSYALEILKVHHSTLLPSLGTDIEGFMGRFSRFVYRKLAKRALVMLDARPSKEQLEQGSYTVVPSDLLYDLISIKDDEDEDDDEEGDFDETE